MSKTRAKGTQFENDVLHYLQERGFPNAKRTEFSSDRGDLEGLPFVIECKNQKTMTLPAWIEQLRKSCLKVGNSIGFVVHKKARANVSESYATIPLKELSELMAYVQDLEVMAGISKY